MAFGVGLPNPDVIFRSIASAATLSDLVWTNVDRNFKARTAGSWFRCKQQGFELFPFLARARCSRRQAPGVDSALPRS